MPIVYCRSLCLALVTITMDMEMTGTVLLFLLSTPVQQLLLLGGKNIVHRQATTDQCNYYKHCHIGVDND